MSATAEVAASPGRIFDVLADPGRHAELDGTGTVQGEPAGPARLFLGAEFTMGMQQLSRQYRSVNRVVEFEEGRRITWESHGVWRGRRVIGGQRWRWTLLPTLAGTAVQHSYLWGYARLPLLTVWLPGYPRRARRTLPRSLSRLTAILDRSVPQLPWVVFDGDCAFCTTSASWIAERLRGPDRPAPGSCPGSRWTWLRTASARSGHDARCCG